ncbi:MGMT family protein [Candidatus Aerophobetes bacterium]|nr:MGMT family protein [Candidatus Aerophobetes bacterium]
MVCAERLKQIVLGKDKEDVLCIMCGGENIMRDREILPSLLLTAVKKDLACYLRGERVDFPAYPLEMNLPPFTRKVLIEVGKIPYGKLRSYKWVAQKVRSKAYRAVGQALSKNPFPVIVPCHRVIREDGGLGGFSAGIELKKRLLELEGIPR